MRQKHILFAFNLFINISTVRCASPKRTVTLHGFSSCADDAKNPLRFNGTVEFVEKNVYMINGEFKINELLNAPLEVFQISIRKEVVKISAF